MVELRFFRSAPRDGQGIHVQAREVLGTAGAELDVDTIRVSAWQQSSVLISSERALREQALDMKHQLAANLACRSIKTEYTQGAATLLKNSLGSKP